MGNMQGWGGPLTRPWLDAQHALQLSIVTRMREFGMTPVLAGFAGHVPRAVALHFPNATYTNSPDWCGFQPQYGSDTLLEAIDPLFTQLGAGFNNMTLADYGDPTHLETPVFNADMFVRGGAPTRLTFPCRTRPTSRPAPTPIYRTKWTPTLPHLITSRSPMLPCTRQW